MPVCDDKVRYRLAALYVSLGADQIVWLTEGTK